MKTVIEHGDSELGSFSHFADQFNLTLQIKQWLNPFNQFKYNASFYGVQVVNNIPPGIHNLEEAGDSIDEAAERYARAIAGKNLVFGAGTKACTWFVAPASFTDFPEIVKPGQGKFKL